MPKPTLRLEYHAPNARKKIRVRNVTSTELDRLRHDGLITREQHDAGEAAMRSLWQAGMLGPVSVNLAGGGGGGDPQPISNTKSRGLKDVGLLMVALDEDVGQAKRRLLTRLLCDDRFKETPANVVAIRQVLTATIRFYDARRTSGSKTLGSDIRQAFGISSE